MSLYWMSFCKVLFVVMLSVTLSVFHAESRVIYCYAVRHYSGCAFMVCLVFLLLFWVLLYWECFMLSLVFFVILSVIIISVFYAESHVVYCVSLNWVFCGESRLIYCYSECHYNVCIYAESSVFIVILSLIILSVFYAETSNSFYYSDCH